jgi:hypothetical protein
MCDSAIWKEDGVVAMQAGGPLAACGQSAGQTSEAGHRRAREAGRSPTPWSVGLQADDYPRAANVGVDPGRVRSGAAPGNA